MLDYIIVGQGIAGSLLSWFLLKSGKRILVIDHANPSSASNIAAGVTNPITGRKFVKTWLADEIIPFAEATYREFETLFNEKIFSDLPIIKLFDSIKAQNDWSARCASKEYQGYLKNGQVIYLDKEKVKNDFGAFEITGGTKLDVQKFISLYRNYLLNEGALLEEKFLFSSLQVKEEFVAYNSLDSRKIIFCEGAEAIHNPWFKFLPFQLAKGECLFVRIPGFYNDKAIIGEVIILPTSEENIFYIGATHDWSFDDEKPSVRGKNELLGNMSAIIKSKFEVTEHKAAIRPTVKDRRPFIGFHPDFSNIGIFNGMGTKGISLAPFFAKLFADSLLAKKGVMNEVDIKRFLL